MTNTNHKHPYDDYLRSTHRLGRIASIITLALLVGAPFVIGGYLGAKPDLGAAARGFLAVGLVWTVSSVAEFLVYTPMLGAGGSYLAFITGNLINMKIPCAMNAREMVKAKTGTAENEIISTLSIATSSLVTILVLAFGVLLLTPLRPVLQSPVLRPAFDQVVPALFGALAYRYFRKDIVLALIPLMVMTALFMFVPSLTSSTSLMIIPSGALAIGLSYLKFRKTAQEDKA
ncbi:MAG: hypothetical protein IJJ80_05350 [Clostridia bacterium]|nr:hypothetical protein [Clostridia bacterium]